MNNPLLMAEKLTDLAKLARTADTDFEKAAIFAAAQAIANMFDQESDQFDGYLLENVEKARWGIAAAVGYDMDNGKDRQLLAGWALSASITMQSLLSKGQRQGVDVE